MRKKDKKRSVFIILLIVIILPVLLFAIKEINPNNDGDKMEINGNNSQGIGEKAIQNDSESTVMDDAIEGEVEDNNKAVNNKEADENSSVESTEIDVKLELLNLENKYNVEMISALKSLENATYELFVANGLITTNSDEKYINDLVNNQVMAILRKDRYYDGTTDINAIFWGTIAGNTDPTIKGVLKLFEDDLVLSIAKVNSNTRINDKVLSDEEIRAIHDLMFAIKTVEKYSNFIDPVTNETIDFVHMIATLDSLYTDINMDQDIEMFVDYLAGWAGDLKTFLPNLLEEIDSGNLNSEKAYKEYVKSVLASNEKSNFSLEDLLADIDAININTILNSNNLLLSEGIIWYYNSRDVEFRYTKYVNSFGSEEAFYKNVYIMLFYKTIEDRDISEYDFSLDDLVGVLELFADIFEHRATRDDELKALYEGYTEIIMDRKNLEKD